MRTQLALCFAALAVAACGPSYTGQDVKTPEELIAEQEAIAAEQEKNRDDEDYDEDYESDEEKKKKFDTAQAKIELKRAARSAATCGGVITEELPAEKAVVTVTFAPEGNVSEKTISAEFQDNAAGKCILNAMGNVIVPPFVGSPVTVSWDVPLEQKKSEDADEKK